MGSPSRERSYSAMDVARYLERIQYDGPLAVGVDALHALHRAHVMAVPFECIDVYLQWPIDLSTEALFEKIVHRRRGGFCYELNGLFAELLRQLGFEVTLLSAQVAREEGGMGPPFDHLTLLVQLDLRWLADVGFPRGAIVPLAFDEREAQERDGSVYRIVPGADSFALHLRNDEGWAQQYRFDLQARTIADFTEMCRFHATSPESPFHGWLGCTVATPDGRVTLSDEKFIERRGDLRMESVVPAHAVGAVLRERFGIALDHDWTRG